MLKKLETPSRQISYEVRKNARSKCMRLHVHPDGRVLVTLPKYGSILSAERFVKKQKDWLLAKLDGYQTENGGRKRTGRKEYLKHKEEARQFIRERVALVNRSYGFSYGRIAVRNQKTRWGSCSSKGNLNFHYKILFLPDELADYLIAHELCHLKELNHSPRFWELVSETVPDHRRVRMELRKHSV